jgi:hypothetical protein
MLLKPTCFEFCEINFRGFVAISFENSNPQFRFSLPENPGTDALTF